MKSFAVVDDDDLSAGILENFIKQFMEEKNIAYKITRYKEAVTFLSLYKASYDIVFMDIMMPHMNGMEASKKLREVDPSVAIIFVTDMANYAVQGYEVSALDFVVKNGTYENFALKMNRAIMHIEGNSNYKMIVNTKTKAEVVVLSSLKYVEVFDHKLVYHLVDRDITALGNLGKVTNELKDKNFSMCNKSYLVNFEHVDAVEEGKSVIIGDTTLPLSRSFKKIFMAQLTDYLGGKYNL